MSKLSIGDQAPDFSLLNQQDQLVKLSDYLGKKHVVLYFYPKDETPGCTKEACGFRDRYEAFTDAGAEVIGVSADSVESHKLFALNRRLPFQLLSDPKNQARKSYGVAGSLFGLLPGRETFIIDKSGKVRFKFASQLNIDPHIDEALKVIEGLASEEE
ncbi:peroxiredoxin [Pontibacter sp. G13]|uniref:peroxiredoxin n=1 Tax=Pontibacter sp. G13 TaxID=3074898 RepID=UPI00288A18B9|nr:peroxiredoxin [Pontibacter sp. G13]WNJ16104.1 peroxiredoxin [Pontibacter sp. G13]